MAENQRPSLTTRRGFIGGAIAVGVGRRRESRRLAHESRQQR